MKKCLLALAVFLLINKNVRAQNFDKSAVEVTPAMQVKLKLDVEKEVPAFKEKIKKWKYGPIATEFAVDTFKVERLTEKWMKLNYTDAGMSEATYNQAKEYDVLLNKYYKKLLGILNAEERTKLVAAQRSWISFRDNEEKLLEAVNDKVYSGGTIEGLTNASEYMNLVQNRTKGLYSYYVRCMHEE